MHFTDPNYSRAQMNPQRILTHIISVLWIVVILFHTQQRLKPTRLQLRSVNQITHSQFSTLKQRLIKQAHAFQVMSETPATI